MADYNKFTSQTFNGKVKKEFVDKSAITGFINNANLDKNVVTLTKKAELKADQDKIINLQAFDLKVFLH